MSVLNSTTPVVNVQADPESVWTDDRPWGEAVGPATLIEEIEHESRFYQTWGTEAGRLLADVCRTLASELRFTGARTAAEHWARAEVLEAWDREGFE
jgi:hypothetical protein